jgi:hypothetical protein
MVFFTNGIPISPADLDFQGAANKDQINRLSAFSQLVNDIPAPNSKIWVPDGAKTWDVYELALTMAQFAVSSSGLLRANAALAANAPAAKAFRPDPTPEWNEAPAGIAQTLRSVGFQFQSLSRAPSPPPAPLPHANALKLDGFAAAEASPPAAGLASLFQNLHAKLASSMLTDLQLGSQFGPTLFYPRDFYQAAYDSYWQPFELTPQQGDVWIPVPAGGKITGEMISISLHRSWWSTWIFSNRGWRFSPESGMQLVSDGGRPPSGSMPLFPSALLIARNVKTVLPPNLSASAQSSNSAAPSFAPFTLLAPSGPSQAGDRSPAVNATLANPAASPQRLNMLAQAVAPVGPPPMTIFAFVCTAIGVCPNPDPSLNWP